MRFSGLVRTNETPLFKALPPSLPAVQRVKEIGSLLKPGPFPHRPQVQSVEFIEGCGHGCPFCPARFAGDGKPMPQVRMVANAAERLQWELERQLVRPHAVLLSASTDPFPPIQEIQNETARVVQTLVRNDIDVWLMTRGFIRPAVLEKISRYAKRVKLTMALTTLDRPMQRLLEPLAAPPRLRLKTLRALREAGIAANVALEPLIPSVTDTRENLLPLLEALAQNGVRSVSVGYMVLHERMEQYLRGVLRPQGLDSLVMDEYVGGPMLRTERGVRGRYLPRSRRQHGYAALMSLAAGMGLRVSVNALTNPDFTASVPPTAGRAERRSLAGIG